MRRAVVVLAVLLSAGGFAPAAQNPALQGPVPSRVAGPAPSNVEGPAPSSVEGPAPSSVEGLPARSDSLKFAVIGDNGNGDKTEYDVGQQMAVSRAKFPFDMVLMLGDNMYGRQDPQDFVTKFERPYAALLQAGVLFYASLGNHDNQNNRFYKGFNMGGERYFSYVKKNVRFFVLDSNVLDPQQRSWLDETLGRARQDRRIRSSHNPLYSDAGRHGADVSRRVTLEPLLVKHGVNGASSWPDPIYERIKPQKGIAYFVARSGGDPRRGDTHPSGMTAAPFDQDNAFMLV